MTTGRRLSERAVVGMLGAVVATTLTMSACGVSLAGGGSGGATSGGSHTLDVCELVPSLRVEVVVGHKVVHATPSHSSAYPYQKPNVFTCSYSLSTGNYIHILVEALNSKAIFFANEANLSADVYPVTSLHGIGDRAGESNRGLAVLTDKYNILITSDYPNQFSGNPAGLIDLARNMISALAFT